MSTRRLGRSHPVARYKHGSETPLPAGVLLKDLRQWREELLGATTPRRSDAAEAPRWLQARWHNLEGRGVPVRPANTDSASSTGIPEEASQHLGQAEITRGDRARR